MAERDALQSANEVYADGFSKGDLPMPPGRRLAIVTCMDARLDPAKFLGLEEGDAHVIRNARGLVTDDALRSLVISHWLLGTEEVAVLAHTDCGMLTFSKTTCSPSCEARRTEMHPRWTSSRSPTSRTASGRACSQSASRRSFPIRSRFRAGSTTSEAAGSTRSPKRRSSTRYRSRCLGGAGRRRLDSASGRPARARCSARRARRATSPGRRRGRGCRGCR
jgi:carbonic anhydrase